MRKTILELHKENMKFSAGHFTIFSATERENLHGHNYQIHCAIHTEVIENGISKDYRYYKQKLRDLCKQLSHAFLLPMHSQHLDIHSDNTHYHITFNNERMSLLKRDVLPMNLENITVEELSTWFIQQLTADKSEIEKCHIHKIDVKCFSGPGQSGSSHWVR